MQPALLSRQPGPELYTNILPQEKSPYCCAGHEVRLLLQAFLRHKNVLITPALLHKEGIPFVKVGAVHSETLCSSVVQ